MRRARPAWVISVVETLLLAIVLLGAHRFGPMRASPRAGAPVAPEALFSAGALRPFEARLSYAPADRHRPYSPLRTEASGPRALSFKDLLERERVGDLHGVATLYALAGVFSQAESQLARLQHGTLGASASSDRAALALQGRGNAEEALALVDRALKLQPGHVQALWNRGLALQKMGLSLGAAADFRAVARAGEPGWSQEASRRADEIAAQHARARADFRAARDSSRKLGLAHELPSASVVRDFPDLVRQNLYEAVRSSSSAAEVQRFLPLARELDAWYGGTSLTDYVLRVAGSDFRQRRRCVEAYRPVQARESVPEPELQALLRRLNAGVCRDIRLGALRLAPSRRDYATERARLVQSAGDPWLSSSDDYFQARTLYGATRYDQARAYLLASIERCDRIKARASCIEQRVLLTFTHLVQQQIQATRAAALDVLRAIRDSGLFSWEGYVYALLGQMENARDAFPLARAYLEEVVLLGEPCGSVRAARQVLADTALDDVDLERAWKLLSEVQDCQDGKPRYELTGAAVLAELARQPDSRYPDSLRLLDQTLAAVRAAPGQLGEATLPLADMIEGSALVLRDAARARALLRQAIAQGEAVPGPNVDATKARDMAYLALMSEAGGRGAHGEVLDLLADFQKVPRGQPCTVAVALDFPRLIIALRDGGSRMDGEFREVGPELERAGLVPERLSRQLSGCEVVKVLATPPLHGSARMLPDAMAWYYVSAPAPRTWHPAAERRLVVSDVDTPEPLRLPRLRRVLARGAGAGAKDDGVTALSGRLATPERVLRELPAHDEIELHVHGIVDRKLSDATALVLTPGADGNAFLTVDQIVAARLPRAPLVVLGACQAALAPRYGPLSFSLPWAFMEAGASAVVASPEPVEDLEAQTFFNAVVDQIRRGASPAVAVRDARIGRNMPRPREWARQVVVFN